MEILIGTDLLAALGSEDATFAVEEFANRHGESLVHAAEILEDVVMNWANDHRRFPEPLTVDSLLADASEGMTEARAWDAEYREEFSYELAREMY
tara:strand:- start:190 stop:474 length:285 start_codon:yes stop_codon:yes gene_type:complete